MDILYKDFFDILINFDTFSRLPPNTDIHLSKTGYFSISAGKLSSVIGAQTISNIYNGYTIDKLIIDLDNYFNRIITIVEKMIITDKMVEIGYKVKILNRHFINGYGDDTHGLFCLLKVYEGTVYYSKLIDIIFNFRDHLDQFIKQTEGWTNNNCPESNFNDQDWAYYMANSVKLQYESIGFYKYYLQYTSSLLYNQMMNYANIWHWYDLIHEFDNGVKIYLGGMPLKSNYSTENRNDLEIIKNLNIKSVLCVVECFENTTVSTINTPITPNEWDINYLQVPIPDFIDISIDKIHTCVEYIHWNIKNNRSIYINCRIGKNRSTLVLMAYLIKYLNYTTDNVYDYIKSKRIQVQNKHFKLLQEYERLCNKND